MKRIGLMFLLCAFTATIARADVWTEEGDAGKDIFTGQSTIGAGALTEIRGNFSASDDGVDLFMIRIVDPASFSAQIQCPGGFDLYMFSIDGRGRFWSSGCQDGVTRLASASSGGYCWLAIAPRGLLLFSPLNELFPQVWEVPQGQGSWRDLAPNGPGFGCRLGYEAMWTGGIQNGGAYTVLLTGCTSSNYVIPTARNTWGKVKVSGSEQR